MACRGDNFNNYLTPTAALILICVVSLAVSVISRSIAVVLSADSLATYSTKCCDESKSEVPEWINKG